MPMYIIILIFINALLLLAVIFLVKEFLKKFKYMNKFIRNSKNLIVWNYGGNTSPGLGLRKIALRGQKEFSILVGFELGIPLLDYSGFDYYGYVKSDRNNMVVFETYLGKNSSRFQFLCSTNLNDNPIAVSCSEKDQSLKPQASFPPHWFQRLGFYG